jgi:hypothetical protein
VKVNDSGMVRITWFNVLNGGGSVIQSYNVEIKNSAGEFKAPADDCKDDQIKSSEDSDTQEPISLCRMLMSKMVSEFGLSYDSPIIARVQAVNSANLKGDWKESDESAKVKTKP